MLPSKDVHLTQYMSSAVKRRVLYILKLNTHSMMINDIKEKKRDIKDFIGNLKTFSECYELP